MAKVSECGSLDEGLKVEARQPSSSRNTERVLFGRELAEKNLKTRIIDCGINAIKSSPC